MGLAMSLMGKGLPTTQMLSLVIGTLERQFIDKKIESFEDFHIAILHIFSTVNSALPGKHYDAPPREDVQACFGEWKAATDESVKKEVLVQFMKEKVNLSKLDDSTLITGIITPPAAMAAKRAGESVPQLNLIKAIPDVIFVPSPLFWLSFPSSYRERCFVTPLHKTSLHLLPSYSCNLYHEFPSTKIWDLLHLYSP